MWHSVALLQKGSAGTQLDMYSADQRHSRGLSRPPTAAATGQRPSELDQAIPGLPCSSSVAPLQRGFSACSRTSPVCAVKSRLDMLPLASGLGQHTILFVLPEEDSIGLG